MRGLPGGQLMERGLAVAGGVALGAFAVPKIVEAITKDGGTPIDPNLINGGQIVLGFLGAKQLKGALSDVCIGIMAGGAANLLTGLIGVQGVGGYGYDYGYDVPTVGQAWATTGPGQTVKSL